MKIYVQLCRSTAGTAIPLSGPCQNNQTRRKKPTNLANNSHFPCSSTLAPLYQSRLYLDTFFWLSMWLVEQLFYCMSCCKEGRRIIVFNFGLGWCGDRQDMGIKLYCEVCRCLRSSLDCEAFHQQSHLRYSRSHCQTASQTGSENFGYLGLAIILSNYVKKKEVILIEQFFFSFS